MVIQVQEILRIENLWYGDWLNGYDLCVNQGEIVYIQCLLEQSLNYLADILTGNLKPDMGRIFIREAKVEPENYDNGYAVASGVYGVSFAGEYMENASIMDNIMPMEPPWHLFCQQKEQENMRRYFAKEHVAFEPDTPMWMLNDVERKKLGILKARLLHADLVVININREVVEGKMAKELGDMIRRMHGEGMAFLILSCCYTFLSGLATRIQYLHQGRALKEWTKVSDSIREKLRHGDFFRGRKGRQEEGKYFIGLYDYEWDLRYDFWEYLRRVKLHNPQIWEQYFAGGIPDSGISRIGRTVVVSKNSQDMLLENLSIGDNLTIAASKRVTFCHTGIVKKRMQRKVEEVFCKEHHLTKMDIPVRELSALQRKILSIARFEILKPALILLELPYQGIDMDERPKLQSYLVRLALKGIRIVYFSKTMENMLDDCKVIIRTQNGMSAKIDTFS